MTNNDKIKPASTDGDECGEGMEREEDYELFEGYPCPCCGAVLTYARFTDYGKITFPHGEESGGDMGFPERVITCPECDEELDYRKLYTAGVLP